MESDTYFKLWPLKNLDFSNILFFSFETLLAEALLASICAVFCFDSYKHQHHISIHRAWEHSLHGGNPSIERCFIDFIKHLSTSDVHRWYIWTLLWLRIASCLSIFSGSKPHSDILERRTCITHTHTHTFLSPIASWSQEKCVHTLWKHYSRHSCNVYMHMDVHFSPKTEPYSINQHAKWFKWKPNAGKIRLIVKSLTDLTMEGSAIYFGGRISCIFMFSERNWKDQTG